MGPWQCQGTCHKLRPGWYTRAAELYDRAVVWQLPALALPGLQAGGDEARVARWSGDRLQLRQGGQDNLAAFRAQVRVVPCGLERVRVVGSGLVMHCEGAGCGPGQMAIGEMGPTGPAIRHAFDPGYPRQSRAAAGVQVRCALQPVGPGRVGRHNPAIHRPQLQQCSGPVCGLHPPCGGFAVSPAPPSLLRAPPRTLHSPWTPLSTSC
jgi:hypothetical protein